MVPNVLQGMDAMIMEQTAIMEAIVLMVTIVLWEQTVKRYLFLTIVLADFL